MIKSHNTYTHMLIIVSSVYSFLLVHFLEQPVVHVMVDNNHCNLHTANMHDMSNIHISVVSGSVLLTRLTRIIIRMGPGLNKIEACLKS